jgi:XTP/dITP diphosphohydrolase
MDRNIIFATNNKHKLEEVRNLLGNSFVLKSLNDIGFSGDIPETQPTLEGNALQKAKFIFDKYNIPCFADDTGLEVESLKGEPGVYSARYSGTLEKFGTEEKRSKENINKLLLNLESKSNRNARFRTVIAFIDNSGSPFYFEGIVNGTIINELKGNKGFGYDPVFIPDGYNITFAEMPLSEKNKISHRARAFSKLIHFLKNEIEK